VAGRREPLGEALVHGAIPVRSGAKFTPTISTSTAIDPHTLATCDVLSVEDPKAIASVLSD
jgi:hypothetical protein